MSLSQHNSQLASNIPKQSWDPRSLAPQVTAQPATATVCLTPTSPWNRTNVPDDDSDTKAEVVTPT